MIYKLPKLKYNYDALEPYFDKKTMKIHHIKHHQTYVNNLNNILSQTEFKEYTQKKLLSNLNILPQKYQLLVRNNLGGHFNHSFFWKNLKKNTILKGELKNSIEKKFSSVEKFQEEFVKHAMNHFGSGWVWLVKSKGDLLITTTSNQDNPLMNYNFILIKGFPIIALDLWEHSYYLKYQNNKLDYIKSYFKIINWDEATKQYLKY
ncbi:superoxide dismutase [Buchnera aphidicola]|uniref:superoxide dismutase n=1 Tax=Buchnera aphidicola TaxID=9 RepID=UPI0022378466|nr:Fe-Mn family superoxide dismutase [Buchnera aphidicola]MCW5197733.1 superoxide dismutase [Mn] [Buchnera aphidicola (Chaitophorus viminalis)]